MDDRREFLRFARRARRRMTLVRAWEGLQGGAFLALCAGLLVALGARLANQPVPWPPVAISLGAAALVAGIAYAIWPRTTLFQAAASADRQAGWKERLSSVLLLPERVQDMERALIDDTRARLQGRSPSQLFPWRSPRGMRWFPVPALGLLAVLLWMPFLAAQGTLASDEATQALARKEYSRTVQKMQEARKEIEKKDRPMERLSQAVRKIEELARDLEQRSPGSDPRESLAEISKVSDEVKGLKDELSRTAAMAQKIQKMLARETDDVGEIGQLLKEGKFDQAAQELAKLRQKLDEGTLSPEDRERIQRQMANLMENLAKDKETSEVAKQIAKAMQGFQEGKEQMADDLQQMLQAIDSDLVENDALADVLRDLEGLADALAKEKKDCPSCGKPKGEGG